MQCSTSAHPATRKLDKTAAMIFARYPRLGAVKTRLAGALGEQGCLALHEAMLLDTVDRVSLLGEPVVLCLAGCSQEEAVTYSVQQFPALGLQVHLQEGSSLGERIWNACRCLTDQFERFLILGSDSPTLPIETMRSAVALLDEIPVVICPVEDGGYCLLGLQTLRRDLFEEIPWGTSNVLETTVAKVSAESLSVLPGWHDIDLIGDLERLAEESCPPGEGYPRRTMEWVRSWRASR